MNYPPEFAESLWLPFGPGFIRSLIVDCNSTADQFFPDPRAWFSATGYRYTERELAGLWGMIECQKEKIHAKWTREQEVRAR